MNIGCDGGISPSSELAEFGSNWRYGCAGKIHRYHGDVVQLAETEQDYAFVHVS